MYVCIYIDSCPLNNMVITCRDPFILGFFSIVDTTVLHDLWLVESKVLGTRVTRDIEPHILCQVIDRSSVVPPWRLSVGLQPAPLGRKWMETVDLISHTAC